MIFGFDTAAARRYAELLGRLFGVESDDVPMPPGFILEVERPEWAFHKRELLWTTGEVNIAASVGNFSRLQIHNPLNSQRLVVVEGFVVANPVLAGLYKVTRDGALAGAPTANLATDTRVPPQAGSRKVGSLNRIDNSLPGVSGEIMSTRQAVAGVDVIFNFRQGPERPIILVPNTVCEIVDATANQTLRALAFGYERPATPDELSQ